MGRVRPAFYLIDERPVVSWDLLLFLHCKKNGGSVTLGLHLSRRVLNEHAEVLLALIKILELGWIGQDDRLPTCRLGSWWMPSRKFVLTFRHHQLFQIEDPLHSP
jgi:hypothetical protein